MKFLNSEGRVICLVEKDDQLETPPAVIPHIDLLIIQEYIKHDIMDSHWWEPLMRSIGQRQDKIHYWR